MADALVGIGANMGEPQAAIDEARHQLERHSGWELCQFSSILRTKAVGASQQPDYCNAAALLRTTLAPNELLARLLAIETAMGRVRTEHWGARIIDLDLLLYEKEIFFSDQLQVPHPWLTVRHFALAPAVEIVPQWIHPLTGATLESLLRCHQRPCISIVGAPNGILATTADNPGSDQIEWLTDPTPNTGSDDWNSSRQAEVSRWVQSNPPSSNRRCVASFLIEPQQLAATLIVDDIANVYRRKDVEHVRFGAVDYIQPTGPFAICASHDPSVLSQAIRFLAASLAKRQG